ncbi:hypothetical protein A1Q2_02966 [Trichosporon asahii var. asahii CBS 8904]|uniref:Uncharacterized protein n=1 Tax=Trichosporon asahii var. asahii (strain CBS 8904) TaxID=1220162 RepID=K1VQ55_TRIAC|nr:hypothetical protein A1Q2_02966 [Trichosporon asahii var. asahii CBS 8904]
MEAVDAKGQAGHGARVRRSGQGSHPGRVDEAQPSELPRVTGPAPSPESYVQAPVHPAIPPPPSSIPAPFAQHSTLDILASSLISSSPTQNPSPTPVTLNRSHPAPPSTPRQADPSTAYPARQDSPLDAVV